MLNISRIGSIVAIATPLFLPLWAIAPAQAQEVRYSCYDADGNRRQQDVSRNFALGYLGYRGASEDGAGQLRSSRGTCIPQQPGSRTSGANNLPPAVMVVLQRCQARVSTAFQNLPATEIAVAPAAVEGDRSAVIAWQTRTGAQGICRIDRNGDLIDFVVQRDPNSVPVNRPGVPSPVPSNPPVTATTNSPQQAFGAVAGIGEFTVLRNSYRDSNAVRQFDALVNGQRQRWWANCRTEAIGTDRQAAPINDATRAVHRFVCTDRF
ncbi:MAG: hypothetical protein HC838_11430 [Spirulinaceae cyanobacterium RM2_2_10]|nr:hypothetical protein [Spirulinaceae cyanobacterium SM2_1_0]NJO20519.1 hypothetical protein [Spirulinaceae cyanobacterium RM2_2_10]